MPLRGAGRVHRRTGGGKESGVVMVEGIVVWGPEVTAGILSDLVGIAPNIPRFHGGKTRQIRSE
ncbi:MAG: hypothetical protein CM1200mP26_13510 [Acidimicrobiales bacterium]|nr:MAG: hypothetical protein CM1200mP26_13510 [Acidimicrobiales bacterium]